MRQRRMRRILEVGALALLSLLLVAPATVHDRRGLPRAEAQAATADVGYGCPAGTLGAVVGASAEPDEVADGAAFTLTLTVALPAPPAVPADRDVWLSYRLPPEVAAVRDVVFPAPSGVASTAWFADASGLTLILTPGAGSGAIAVTAVGEVQLRAGVAPATLTFSAPDRLVLVAPPGGAPAVVCGVDGVAPSLVSVVVSQATTPTTAPPTTTTTVPPTTSTTAPPTTTTTTPPDPASHGDAPSPPAIPLDEVPDLPASPDPSSASRVVTADLDGARSRLDQARADLEASTAALDALRDRTARLEARERRLEARRNELSAQIDEASVTLARRATDAYIAAVDAYVSLASTGSDVVMMGAVLEDGAATYDELLAQQADVVAELGRVAATRARGQDDVDGAAADTRELRSRVDDGRYQLVTFENGGDLAVSGFRFPVGGTHDYTDTWGAPRSGGRRHQGTDVFAAEGTPLVAVERGVLARVGTDDLGGIKLWLVGESGTQYYYAHLSGYADGVADGLVVGAGQVIGYVGHTGNARTTPPHLHFEVHPAGGDAIDSYPMLVAADGGGGAAATGATDHPVEPPQTTTTTASTTTSTTATTAGTATTSVPVPPTGAPTTGAGPGTATTSTDGSGPGATIAARPAYVRTWGTSGSGDGALDTPSGVAVAADGAVYVADTGNDRVERFAADGTFEHAWGGPGSADGRFHRPSAVAVAPSGAVYVADTGNNRIQQFTADGRFVRAWGATGARAGRFNEPSGVAVGPDGTVYVADTLNNRIQAFGPDGTFVDRWGGFGAAPGQFANPLGLTVDGAGDVYVADTFNGRIQRFTAEGAPVSDWGDGGAVRAHRPRSVTISAVGGLVVADRADRSDRAIRQYDETGAFVRAWGRRGAGPGRFVHPDALAAAGRGGLYVADTGNDRVQQFTWVPAGR